MQRIRIQLSPTLTRLFSAGALLGLCLASQFGWAQSSADSVTLTDTQLKFVAVVPVTQVDFTVDRDSVGSTDYNEDMTVQVSPPYQGRIIKLYAKAGDMVRKGQPLFTIDSPDLLQAESTLMSSAGTLELTNSVLKRATELYAAQGMAQKDYQQAVSDQLSATAAYQSAVSAVRIFGKSTGQIDQIVNNHHIDSIMPVFSPISGRVVARNAAPGTLSQPGATPAPYVVSDITSKWLLANVSESDMPLLRLGQTVEVHLLAYPGRVFHGHIDNISEAVDPNTHRVTVRSVVRDPGNVIAPQMMATFTVHTGNIMHSLAVPYDGVVREGDGAMTVWVTQDNHHFYRRTVKLGMQQHGMDQILSGLQVSDRVVGEGALFISNAWVMGLN